MFDTFEMRRVINKWFIGVFNCCILIYLGFRHISSIACAVSRITDLVKPLVIGAILAPILNVPMSFLSGIYCNCRRAGTQRAAFLFITRKQKLPFSLRWCDVSFGADEADILRIGVPLALQEILTGIWMLALCAFVNRMGLAESSGYGVAQKIHVFVLLVPISIMQCMAPFVS